MTKGYIQLIIGFLLLHYIPGFAQTQANRTLVESSRREVSSINNMVLNRAYVITPGDPDVVLVGKLAVVDYPQWRPRVYFDSNGRVRKFVETGEDGNINISYYDKSGYLRYMVARDDREGKGFSAIIYANNNNIVNADIEGHNDELDTPGFSQKLYSGKIPYAINRVVLGALSRVDSIERRYGITLVASADYPKVGFKPGKPGEVITLNRGELAEPVEYRVPTEWEISYFGDPATAFVPDEAKMEKNRQAANDINSLPLKKFYLLNDSISSVLPSWQLLTSHLEQEILAHARRANYVYIDSEGRIRKYIRRSVAQKDNTWNLIAYYDERGDLLKLLCDNDYYDTIYCYRKNIREVYDIKTSSVFGSIFRLDGELLSQGYSQADFNDTRHPLLYRGAGTSLLPTIGKVDISNFYRADSLAASLQLTIHDYILEAGIPVCFNGDSLRDFTMTGIPDVPLRLAPSMNARVQATLSAGLDTYIIERAFDEFTRQYGTFPWYKVYFDDSTNFETGYIYGYFLEPEEIVFTP